MARFITFEGLDGSGKSTHLERMARRLEAAGVPFVDGRIMDRALFADPIHVNGAGSDQVTDDLAAELGPAG